MSDMLSQVGVPPGWYADPYGRAVQRYFNGSAWTPYVIDAAGIQQAEGPGAGIAPAPPSATAGPGAIVIQNVVHVPQPLYSVAPPSGPGSKSPGTAVVLAAVFGPLGVLYVNVGVALALTAVWLLMIWTLIVPFGIWVGGMVYAYNAAQQHNLRRIAMAVGPQPIYGDAQPPSAWQLAPPVPLATRSFGSMPPPPAAVAGRPQDEPTLPFS